MRFSRQENTGVGSHSLLWGSAQPRDWTQISCTAGDSPLSEPPGKKDFGIWSYYFMMTKWGKSGNSNRFYFLGSTVTVDGDCSHEIKRCLLLGRKAMTNLESILKSRDIILLTKVSLIKAMVFPVVVYRCEKGNIKKAEHQRVAASELWCWRRLLRVSWNARRSNQSILKEINPGYSSEGLMLKLKL